MTSLVSFDFVRQLPVDCRPIFDSESWGSTWSADRTLFSFWGRSKSIIFFWQIHHVLTENYPRSTADCWVHQIRHQERAGIKSSVNHFILAAQQELQVYCCISLFQKHSFTSAKIAQYFVRENDRQLLLTFSTLSAWRPSATTSSLSSSIALSVILRLLS